MIRQELFQPGECPDAALYCGWYSLAHYVDAFKWRPGSVGYHIASSECQTLKQKESQVWCKRMLEEGIAATVGPVGEPYVQAFPIPEMFFEFLLDGSWTLAECYALSQPFWSWQMVLDRRSALLAVQNAAVAKKWAPVRTSSHRCRGRENRIQKMLESYRRTSSHDA